MHDRYVPDEEQDEGLRYEQPREGSRREQEGRHERRRHDEEEDHRHRASSRTSNNEVVDKTLDVFCIILPYSTTQGGTDSAVPMNHSLMRAWVGHRGVGMKGSISHLVGVLVGGRMTMQHHAARCMYGYVGDMWWIRGRYDMQQRHAKTCVWWEECST